jgi:hypothetical protein
MHERILRDFFVGRLDATALSRDLEGSIVRKGVDEAGVRIVDLTEGRHLVTAEQLVRICDAVEKGLVEPWKVEAIGFCLVESDHFFWDPTTPEGGRVDEVLGYWSDPLGTYPLTRGTIAKAGRLLLTGENTFAAVDFDDEPERAWNVRRVSKVPEREPRFRDELR